ncbi:resistance to inhibitors of cholinesterase protein 3 isoform X15 [Drosophila pseudoobscura]|uniref:Resistance to inhibitors of cholinesterase protein 3 isoform X15 n=1 Tax=Drosophila pseudoobscura pseudoobscura TaxID=46245 RepID=A0A6I8VRS9_DROPS|nr:resistance to inhibitors of cholinesterase protein 3 isoform X15 [Drosophila pseudoobscura]
MPSAATKKRPSVVKEEEGMTPKKTALIIVTVIGCIAILWPKVFHPMMFGSAPPPPPQQQNLKDQRSGAPGGLRQERPAHLHPESIYQAMRERGRAIPATPTVPIVERKSSASNPPPRIVDGRPGPIPGMRPPMGAGALQQPQQRGSSMGFLMPLYTIGIVVFFGYTIMKIAFKKQVPNAPYGPAPSDTGFRQQVFGQQQEHSQVEDLGGTKLVVTAIQGLIDAADEQLNVRDKQRSDTETDLNKQNDNEKTKDQLEKDKEKDKISSNGHANVNTTDQGADPAAKGVKQQQQRKRRDLSAERELTSKLEGNLPEPQSIYLEGALAHDSQILVADAQTKREEVYDTELNGSAEEPAVILSSKMTLSLINLDANQQNGNWGKPEIESPLADDIEIIGHDEQ